LTGEYPPVKVDVDSLVEEWIEKCIAEGRSANRQQFTLKSAVPLAAAKGPLVELVNKTLDREQTKDKTVTYVTSKELENIWKANTFRAMGKPMESFDEDEAMMMLDDEDERELLGAEEVAESLEDTEQETIITLQVMLVQSSLLAWQSLPLPILHGIVVSFSLIVSFRSFLPPVAGTGAPVGGPREDRLGPARAEVRPRERADAAGQGRQHQ
jgi:hypothetical protein